MTKFLAALGFLVLALPAHAKPNTESTAPEPRAERAWLGVNLQDLDDDLREAMDIPASLHGVLVPEVVPGSPARTAGLRSMDVITEIDGRRVASADDVIDRMGDLSPGKTIPLDVWRDGESKTLSVTLGSTSNRPEDDMAVSPKDDGGNPRSGRFWFHDEGDKDDDKGDDDSPHRHRIVIHQDDRGYLGVRTMELGEQLAAYFGVKEDQGVLVTEVLADSPAQKAGLEAGDVILTVDGDDVTGPGDVRRAVGRHDPGETVEVRVNRRGAERAYSVTLAEAPEVGMIAPMAPRGPHGMGWHGEDFVIPIPDLRRFEMQVDPEDAKRFREDLRREMDELRQELRDLRLKLHEKSEEGKKDQGD